MTHTGTNQPRGPSARDATRRRRVHEPAFTSMSLNMTPMIDVVFLLLVYFILGASFAQRQRALPARAPRGREIATVTAGSEIRR